MGYRKELTRLIIEECHGGTLLVVGAGECNDIDIEKLNVEELIKKDFKNEKTRCLFEIIVNHNFSVLSPFMGKDNISLTKFLYFSSFF